MLCIVQQNGLIGAPLRCFAGAHGAPQYVQAIGLGAGAGMGIDAQDDARIIPGDRRQCCDRVQVIGIDADEDAIIAMPPTGQGVAQHGADDVGFTPGGYEDSDGARLR